VAIEAFNEADEETSLSPDDLMLLADALWWSAQPDEAVVTFERAFGAYLRADQVSDAAIVGSLLAYLSFRRMSASVAMAWASRVEKLLEGQPESAGHAWFGLIETAKALFFENDLEAVKEIADRTIEIAANQNLIGPQALAMSFKGIALTYQGKWKEGTELIDESIVLAMSRGDDLRASSDVYCNLMGVCSSLADYRRAVEWTEEAERWMKSNAVGGFTGVCQVHRAELKRLRGDWSEAERDARVACNELERFHLLNGLGFANYEIGEVRRRRGDLDAAEEAFTRAYEYGHTAQPGFALLLMDRGDLDGAAKSIDGAVEATRSEHGGDLLTRGHLLPAQIEIAVAAGDLERARHSISELEEIAQIYDSQTWQAMLLSCRGSLQLEEGDADAALRNLDEAWRIWQQTDLPYEAARARELLGRARLAAQDGAGARLEFGAARSTYERLGARLDLRRLEKAVGPGSRRQHDGARLTKAFMFTDIVTSTDLIGLIGDEAWQRLLDWHDRELRSVLAEHHGEEVRHTGDGFFVAFDSAREAVDAAVDIQRRLADHRLEHGFSPTIRIGLHLAEATRQRGDYVGGGVHVAARIGDLGDGDEIVISEQLIRGSGTLPYGLARTRDVELKGVKGPTTVSNVDWRR
jgi:class 3 adenylate cyclase